MNSNIDELFNFKFKDNIYITLQRDLSDFYKSENYENFNKFKFSINKFIKLNSIDIKHNEYLEILSKIFVDFVLVFYKNLTDIQISSTFSNFVISAIRIFEFVLFISNTNNIYLIKRFIKNYSFNSKYFFFLKNQNLEIISIKLAKRHKRNVIEISVNSDLFFYFSSISIQQFQKEVKDFFKHFLKLDDKYVEEFYLLKIEKSSKTFGNVDRECSKRIPFEILEDDIEKMFIKKIILFDSNTKNISKETKKEITFSNKMIFPTLDDKLSKFIKIPKKEINSTFKRFQIARAISNQIVKQNLKLPCSFKFPDFLLFKQFLEFVQKENPEIYPFIILPVILGIPLQNIFDGLANKAIKLNENKLTIKYFKKIFAKIANDIKISEPIIDSFYIHLNEQIIIIFNELQINKYSFDIEHFKKELKNLQKKFHKKIVLPLELSILFEVYSTQFFNYSIDLLFRKNISKNEEAKLCYCASLERLYSYEKMINNISYLLGVINEKKELNNHTQYSDLKYIGSNFYIKRNVFRNFLHNLNILYNSVENSIDRMNIRMIYIRYSLSILLATRDFFNSCNLSNYSKTFNVLIIQEKAKNIFSSIRIIPLIPKSKNLIKEFYQLKDKFNIDSNFPVLILNNKEIEINKSNVATFLNVLRMPENETLISDILKFTSIVKLNFGRHIVTTFFNFKNVKKEYIDAFLNHFKNGTEDQGIYTNLNNKQYIETIQKNLILLEYYFFKD